MSDDTTEPASQTSRPVIEETLSAPFTYFDAAPTYGHMSGAIQIELASRVLIPQADNVQIKFLITGHLRCSPAAAVDLRNAIDAALKMLETPQQEQVAANKLN